jgi:hypothetical protein
MLTSEKRAGWFHYVELLASALPKHHDAVLFWLNNDSNQWAYLLSLPDVWSDKFTNDAVEATSKIWTKGVSALSYRKNRSQFADQIAKLFLTGDEYANR